MIPAALIQPAPLAAAAAGDFYWIKQDQERFFVMETASGLHALFLDGPHCGHFVPTQWQDRAGVRVTGAAISVVLESIYKPSPVPIVYSDRGGRLKGKHRSGGYTETLYGIVGGVSKIDQDAEEILFGEWAITLKIDERDIVLYRSAEIHPQG